MSTERSSSTLSTNNIEPLTATNSGGQRADSGKTGVSGNQMMVSLQVIFGSDAPFQNVCDEHLRKRRFLMENRDGDLLIVVADGVRLLTHQQRFLDSASFGERIKLLLIISKNF